MRNNQQRNIQADFRLYKKTFLVQLQTKLILKNVNCSCLFTKILTIFSLQTGIDDVNEHARHHPERQGQGGHQGPDEVGPQEAERGCRTKWIAGH